MEHFRHCISDIGAISLAGVMITDGVERPIRDTYHERIVQPRWERIAAVPRRGGPARAAPHGTSTSSSRRRCSPGRGTAFAWAGQGCSRAAGRVRSPTRLALARAATPRGIPAAGARGSRAPVRPGDGRRAGMPCPRHTLPARRRRGQRCQDGVHDRLARRNARPAPGPRRRGGPRHGLLHPGPRPRRRRPAGRVRHLGASRVEPEDLVQRDPHPRDHPGHLRLPAGAGLRRTALHRAGTPTACHEPAWSTALEVLAANDVTVLVDDRDGYTPTPAVSHAIIRANAGRTTGPGLADGIVVTPSHNPPSDGGFKYNPPHGGPADTDATKVIAERANALIRGGLAGVERVPFAAGPGRTPTGYDFTGYLRRRPAVGARHRPDPRRRASGSAPTPSAGASVGYWGEIAERLGLDLTVVNPLVDATWRFMTLDWDGKIRMDCSSPSAMASLIERRDDVRHRDRQRRRRRPARHRHPRRGPDEPQPLPRRRDRLPLRRRPSRLAGHGADRQDPRVELDDRQGRRRAAPPARRGAGGLQVVRPRSHRRLVRVRRRGVGRRVVPPPRRTDLDDRQGRHPPRPARLRDPRGDRAAPRASTTPS